MPLAGHLLITEQPLREKRGWKIKHTTTHKTHTSTTPPLWWIKVFQPRMQPSMPGLGDQLQTGRAFQALHFGDARMTVIVSLSLLRLHPVQGELCQLGMLSMGLRSDTRCDTGQATNHTVPMELPLFGVVLPSKNWSLI